MLNLRRKKIIKKVYRIAKLSSKFKKASDRAITFSNFFRK